MNLLYQLRVHARWVSGSKYTSESVPHSIIQVYYPVLQGTPELPCSTKCYTIESRRLRVCWSDTQSDTKRYPKRCPNYSSTTPYYKVLLRTTKYYSSTTKYYSSTTKYYANTTPYYKVLLQYYSVLLAAVTVAAPHALRMKKNPHEKDCECSCIQHNWTIPPNP